MKRVFVIVLDGFGIGEMPDAECFGDVGSNTFRSCQTSDKLNIPNLKALGLCSIDGNEECAVSSLLRGAFGRLTEQSMGKDTTVGHWELMGEISSTAFPTYPNGFPNDIIEKFETLTGRKVLCNQPYSGTRVLEDFGERQVETGGLIVYTSADSVFQIAAHENVIPVRELYAICETARALLTGEHAVARVIARPFIGVAPCFTRTAGRHDFSLAPVGDTAMDILLRHGLDVIGVGKISDIFAGKGLSRTITTQGNRSGIMKTLRLMREDFHGLCFVNLVDTDMLYGHRNDVDGFANALSEFDFFIPQIEAGLGKDDMLIITADHGCDPGTTSTDHSREYVPVLITGKKIRPGVNLGTRTSFADVGATVLEALHVKKSDNSFFDQMMIGEE